MAKRKSSESEAVSVSSFEKSLEELQLIVSELDDGALGLEASLARFERGVALLRACYSLLDAAEARVEILTRFDGEEAIMAKFDASATFVPTRERSGSTKIPIADTETPADSGNRPEDSAQSSLF
jgi:exodeoxyribonuclease VII small subunit